MSPILACLTLSTLTQDGPALGSPKQKVEGTTVLCPTQPRLKISFPKSMQYVGSDRWNLFGVADCELHVFVEADRKKQIKSYGWVQFESLLPSSPNSIYEYRSGTEMSISGLNFNVRPRFGVMESEPKPGSEIDHVIRMVTKKGFTFPKEIMNVRLVHLPEPTRRTELLIFYAEDLAPSGASFDDLVVNGSVGPKWAPIESSLLERVQQKIKLNPWR